MKKARLRDIRSGALQYGPFDYFKNHVPSDELRKITKVQFPLDQMPEYGRRDRLYYEELELYALLRLRPSVLKAMRVSSTATNAVFKIRSVWEQASDPNCDIYKNLSEEVRTWWDDEGRPLGRVIISHHKRLAQALIDGNLGFMLYLQKC